MNALKKKIIYLVIIIAPFLYATDMYGANEEILKVKSFTISGSTIEITSTIFDD